jgi:hypothetical protein
LACTSLRRKFRLLSLDLFLAGFRKMDGRGGLVGLQWMFLLYGLVTIIVGISLLWWLPDRPLPPGEVRARTGWRRWSPKSPPALKGEDAVALTADEAGRCTTSCGS